MTRPTMEDVAAQAGVSRALVSIVYRDVPGASDATRARVLAAGAELGYRPDHRARLLGRQRTRLIGVTFDVRGAFHGELIDSLYPEAESLGYDLTLSAVTPNRPEAQAIQSLLDYRCEALILLGATSTPSSLAALAESQPTVVIARKVRAAGVHVVRTDDEAGARLATEHLLSLGHTNIAHLDGGRSPGAAERRTGYRTTMRRAGLTPVILPGGPTEPAGTAAADRIPAGITAIAAFNDASAIGLLHALEKAGRRVPEDLSLTGYDDTPAAALPHIALTTIAQDPGQLTKLAITHLTGDPNITSEVTVPPALIHRGTTAAISP